MCGLLGRIPAWHHLGLPGCQERWRSLRRSWGGFREHRYALRDQRGSELPGVSGRGNKEYGGRAQEEEDGTWSWEILLGYPRWPLWPSQAAEGSHSPLASVFRAAFLSPVASCLTSEGLQEYPQGNFPLTHGLGENRLPSCLHPVKLYAGQLSQGQRHWVHGFGGLRFDRGCPKQSQSLPRPPKTQLNCASASSELSVKNHNLN